MDDPSPDGDPHVNKDDMFPTIRVADAERSLAEPSLQHPNARYTPDATEGGVAASDSVNASDLNLPRNDDSVGPLAGSDASHSVELRRTALNPAGTAQCQSLQHPSESDTGNAHVLSTPRNAETTLTLNRDGNTNQPYWYGCDFEPRSNIRVSLAPQTGFPADDYGSDSLPRFVTDARSVLDGSGRLPRIITTAQLSSPTTTFIPQRSSSVAVPMGIGAICLTMSGGQIPPSPDTVVSRL